MLLPAVSRRCSGGRYALDRRNELLLDWVCSHLLVLSSVKALATLRWLQGPPRPDPVCWAVPVCNCSVLPFYWLCPPRWVELARSRSQ